MKKILLFLSVFMINFYADSQSLKKSTYLIVRIDYDYDKATETPFYKINAEQGNPYASEIYGLLTFNIEKKAINNSGTYFSNKADTTKVFYNYFKNATEALSFLSHNNWELVNIYNQITSSYKYERVGTELYPYTTVSSYPIYYFSKSIE